MKDLIYLIGELYVKSRQLEEDLGAAMEVIAELRAENQRLVSQAEAHEEGRAVYEG